ncbi:MAG: lactate utilization protein [Lachnospiraceae bacterium]|nr:lactate utilization protein [Lachnospiraceae bacterium]
MTDRNKKIFYRNQAEQIIKKLSLRKMEGYYADDMEEAVQKVLELIGPASKTVSYGGSMTIDNSDLKDRIVKAGHDLIIREDYKTDEETKKLKAMMINSDTFLMSTNAITLDGELINIDGRGNRVSYMIYGPDQVIVIAGMNKVVKDVAAGLDRTRNMASPANTVRLNCDTPCAKTGRCADCLEHTICCQMVITRASMVPGRIKVILVGEEVGY